MKQVITSGVIFSPSARTLNFSGISGFDIRRLYAVINTTAQAVIYAPGKTGLGYAAVTNSVVTLSYDTTAMGSGDALLILYDDAIGFPAAGQKTAAGSLSVVTASDDPSLTVLGAQADAAATSDVGAFSLVSLLKRGLTNWTTLLGRLPVLASGRIPVDNSGVTQPVKLSDTRNTTTLDVSSTSNGLTLDVPDGAATIRFYMSGLGTSAAILNIVVVNDGVNFGTPFISTLGGGSRPALGVTTDGFLAIPVAGIRQVRFVVATAGTGTVTVNYTFSAAPLVSGVAHAGAGAGGISSVVRLPVCTATLNPTAVKTSPGRLYRVSGYNIASSARRLKFFNKATAPVPGTDTPFLAFALPPGPFSFSVADIGWTFSTGIGFGITVGAADNDTVAPAAGDITDLQIDYA